jgi:hypothetical protein
MCLFQQNDLQLDADKDEDQGPDQDTDQDQDLDQYLHQGLEPKPDQDTDIDLDKDQHFTEEKILVLIIILLDSNVQIVCLEKSSIYLLYHYLYQT